MADQAALEAKIDRLSRDIVLLQRGVAHLISKLPEAPMQEPKDVRELLATYRRRPDGVDNLTWALQQALALTEHAVRDIEQAKLRIDSLARGSGRALWSTDLV
jgi:hypothetical protein